MRLMIRITYYVLRIEEFTFYIVNHIFRNIDYVSPIPRYAIRNTQYEASHA
jgi:hypothetical protein